MPRFSASAGWPGRRCVLFSAAAAGRGVVDVGGAGPAGGVWGCGGFGTAGPARGASRRRGGFRVTLRVSLARPADGTAPFSPVPRALSGRQCSLPRSRGPVRETVRAVFRRRGGTRGGGCRRCRAGRWGFGTAGPVRGASRRRGGFRGTWPVSPGPIGQLPYSPWTATRPPPRRVQGDVAGLPGPSRGWHRTLSPPPRALSGEGAIPLSRWCGTFGGTGCSRFFCGGPSGED